MSSKSILIILSYTVSKLICFVTFVRHSVDMRERLIIWFHSHVLPIASRNDCLLAFMSGLTVWRSRTAGGLGRLRSAGGGGSCRHLIAAESTVRPAPVDAAGLLSAVSPFLTATTFSESLLPVNHRHSLDSQHSLYRETDRNLLY